jgi:hypothetical protein
MEVNPNALIFVEGVEQYPKAGKVWGQADSLTDPPYYPGWWGGQFRGVRDYPIDLGEYQSQLVYSPHDYGPGVYAQTWFDKDFTTQTLLDDYWYDTWAFINEEDIAPLLIGEWGGFMDGGDNEKWLTLLRDYMIDNHINHTFWCINPNSGDTGGLLDYSFTNWDEDKYNLFEPSLWQDDDGVYISLDHQTALGSNGQSLSEFYASGKGSNLDASGESNPKDVVITDGDTTTTTTEASTVTTVGDDTETSNTTTASDELCYGTITEITDTDIVVETEDGEVLTASITITDGNLVVGNKVEVHTTGGTVDSITLVDDTTTTTGETTELSTPSEGATDTTTDSTGVTSGTNQGEEESTVVGDATLDGDVLANDLTVIKKYILNLSTLEGQAFTNADVNHDGDVLANDLLWVKKYILGIIDSLDNIQ